ncbi:hypothetical protein XELAEV_18015991mg [Xenopus laevis]|uniref:Reverse transcriptase domain-containing protein n=1 Tax=Xenopus laevis TaxID=8355 RepID=A0A974DJ34_XENLA|nr:hypothetical protein XELAEV_18015991mg [Xenopus laevis]
MDVESLYSNIPHEDGIAAFQHFLEINHVPTVPTLQLIRFILTHNYFSLGDAIYLQLMGSAMGSKMAPQYANLFMAQLEENYLASCNTRPLTYLRFNQFHPTINLTLNHFYSHINFLDTTIYIKNGTIQTSLYQKPTGRPAYLMWDSFHPHHIKKSIVFSQALRYNRICSNLDDRYKHLHSLRETFVNQGYHPQSNSNTRDTLLNYKEKTENNRVPIVVTYNPQLNIIRKIVRDLRPMLHTDTRLKPIFPELPLLSYRQPPNLRKMIARSALPKTTKAVYTILDHYSCASSNVVYIITCTRCCTGGIYIGDTGQKLRTRMNHHRHKINTKSCDTPVGQHFCSQNHSLQDMQVLILKGNFKTERERKIYEYKCMELFNTLRQGLNLGSGFISHYVT